MTFTPILASDMTGALVYLIAIPIAVLALIALLAIALNAKVGRRRWWGLMTGLIPTVGGGFALLILMMTNGGAPGFFYLAAGFPFLCGLCSLYLWNRAKI